MIYHFLLRGFQKRVCDDIIFLFCFILFYLLFKLIDKLIQTTKKIIKGKEKDNKYVIPTLKLHSVFILLEKFRMKKKQ